MITAARKGGIFLMIVSFFFSCQRELFFDNNNPVLPGVYTFISGNDSCTGFEVAGTYKAGIALSDSNRVSLSVNISTPGAYTITTATANGIIFTDSGSFITTGIQNITLKGSGTPADTGIYTFRTGSTGCSFSIRFTGSPNNNSAGYSMAGSPDSCTGFLVAGTYLTGETLDPAVHYVTVNVNVLSTGSYSIGSAEVNNMNFSKSGIFTSTGNQVLKLEARGKPITGGNFSYRVGTFPGSCNFSVTVLPAAPVALGSLNCSMATIAGVYKQGIALSSGNTVSIPANITIPGSYSISTGTINGCVFSASGDFQAGDQLILLSGTGTPAAAGNFSFPVNLGINNCSFAVAFEP
jgi:hypothetical protein